MAGVYISWPFCAQKCTFCNFASGVQPKNLEVAYAAALVREIKERLAKPWAGVERAEFDRGGTGLPPVQVDQRRAQRDIDTVYLGGGTPSTMPLDALASVLDRIPGRPWREATIEAAPGTLMAERISGWKALGINRVSLGVQSFVKAELSRTGRRHDAATVERDIRELRAAGIRNFNIDLIAGLPEQSEASWRESLAWIAKLSPPHVSVYMLEVDQDSRLGAELLNGGLRYGAGDVPSEEAIASFYEIAVQELAKIGIQRYEISNFAIPGAESIHNLKYWRREPYFGFGADAHSFDGSQRWQNVETAREYGSRSEAGQPVRTEAADAVPHQEKFFVGLRLMEGVETDEQDWQRFGHAFERLIGLGVLDKNGSRLKLTHRGIMVSNEVFEEFIAA